MSWIICFLVSALWIFVAIALIAIPIKRKADYMFLSIVLAGFFSYFPHYLSMYDLLNSVIADIVNLLQIITLNSNTYETFQGVIPTGSMFYPYIIIRGIVHVSTPVLFAYVAFEFLFTQLACIKRRILCCGKKTIYIFCEYNELASVIVSDVQRNEKNVTFVFLRDEVAKDKHIDNVEEYIGHVEIDKKRIVSLDKEHFLYFLGRLAKSKHTNLHIFCNEINNEKNINVCLSIIQYCKDNLNESDVQHLHIDVFARSNDSTASLIDSVNEGMLSIRIVDRYQIAAYRLLMKRPLYDAIEENDGRKRLSVAIFGQNESAIECLKAVIWCGQLPEIELEVHLIVNEGNRDDVEKKLKIECPEVCKPNYAITIHDSEMDMIEICDENMAFMKDVGYIIICSGDDDKNYSHAIRLQRQYYKCNHYEPKCPFIMPEISSSMRRNSIELMVKGLSRLNLNLVRIFPFGDLNSIYSYDELIESKLFRLGKNVNYAYEEYFSPNGEQINEKFLLEKAVGFKNNENSKKSNMAAALHIQYKLWILGYAFCESDDPEQVSMNDLRIKLVSDDDCIEKLCRAEHDRWVAYHRSEGWTTESPENIQKIYENKMGKKNKSALMKTHIDICSYDDIKSRRKQYGLEDTTPLDKAIIQRIPDILEDRWSLPEKKKQLYIKKM